MDKLTMFRLSAIFLSVTCLSEVTSQLSDNTPPYMHLNRDWEVSYDEPIGSHVTRVKATDGENDPLTFGLEHTEYFGLSGPAPFAVDNKTGVVTVNASLHDLAGQQFSLYVTVSDGELSTKTEVRIHILPDKIGTSRPLASKPPPPIFSHNNPPPPPPLPPRIRPPASPIRVRTSTTSTTKETPTQPPSTPAAEVNVTSSHTPAPASSADLASTVVPALAVGALLTAGAGGALWLFRRRLCRRSEGKEHLRKEAAGGMAMQTQPALTHWRGPRAGHNRYEPWEREANVIMPDGPAVISGTGMTEKPSSDHWEFPRHRLRVFHILGEGCFGQVWKCEANDIDGREGATVVAVKTLKEHAGDKEREDLQQELRVMKMLEPHPNVVRLLGCCTEKDPLFVIMEYAAHGKLQSFLRNSRAERHYGNLHGRSDSLTSRDLTSYMYQVARGMEYLSSKGIVHRDLAARNVLVTSDRTCKVADFGFARDIAASLVYERKSEGRLPIRWMAPESLYDNVFSAKSDVWSFGVFMWEVVTLGSTPYPGLAAAEVLKRVREGLRLEKPEHCRREIYNIMFYCWDKSPTERPTFNEIVHLLERLLVSETDYIELERFPDHSYYNMVSLSGEKL